MGLKTDGAKLLLKGGLLNRTLYVAAMRSESAEFAAAAQNGYANYARVAIALAGWTRTNDGLAENAAAVDFPVPTADSTAAPTHWGLYSAAGSGTLYATRALAGSPGAPTLGATFGFDAGTLELARAAGAVTGRGLRLAYESGLLSATTYLGLFESQPSGSNPGAIDDRVAIATGVWAENPSAQHTMRNNAAIQFGVQATDVDRPMWVGLFDASSAGNLLWEDQLDTTPPDPAAGATLTVEANEISIGFQVDA